MEINYRLFSNVFQHNCGVRLPQFQDNQYLLILTYMFPIPTRIDHPPDILLSIQTVAAVASGVYMNCLL